MLAVAQEKAFAAEQNILFLCQDMVHLDFMDFAIFNVADSYLTVGVVMLFIVLWREGEDGINH